MVEFVRHYARLVYDYADEQSGVGRTMHSPLRDHVLVHAMTRLKEIVKAVSRLDARDFEPAAHVEFLRVRGNLSTSRRRAVTPSRSTVRRPNCALAC